MLWGYIGDLSLRLYDATGTLLIKISESGPSRCCSQIWRYTHVAGINVLLTDLGLVDGVKSKAVAGLIFIGWLTNAKSLNDSDINRSSSLTWSTTYGRQTI